MRTAAQLFVECLENEGVRHVFGIPGEETLDLNEALDHSGSVSFIPVRHEQGAALMAGAYRTVTRQARLRARRSWRTPTGGSPATPASAWAPSARAPPTSSPGWPTPFSTGRRWSR